MFLRRRRPLMRAAVVGGTAYAIGRNHANNDNREQEQEQRLQDLENEPVAAKGGMATSSAPETNDITTQIEKLAQLKNAGVLNEQEFEAAKQKLLTS